MSDLIHIFVWWFVFFVFGIASFPLTTIFFKKFLDCGYGFSKIAGLLVITYIIFLLSTLHILPFSKETLFTIFFVYAVFNVYLFRKNHEEISLSFKKSKRALLLQEVLFTTGLVLWSYVRAHQPDINGLEKFMDFGFINSILRSEYLPPSDIWASGEAINYYWFGHLATAVATKISGIPSHVTYNLMIATILGFCLTASFSIISTLVSTLNLKLNSRTAYAAGIISAIILAFAGNFHTPIYLLKKGREAYWYPDATRFIGYNPETNDKTIHEFPIYSFVVSDLHPHLMNLPFVLLYLALLANYILNLSTKSEARSSKQYRNSKLKFLNRFRTLEFSNLNLFGISNFVFRIFPLGFLIGIFFMTNTWDFANYLFVSATILFFMNLRERDFKLETFLKRATNLVTILALGIITALPFILNFESIAEGIKLTHTKSPLWQLSVLWGFPALLSSSFALFIFRKKAEKNDIFVLSLLAASWVLIIIPEFVYIKDIYIASHYRANTMFKLTYQAYVMFYLASGYIAVRSIVIVKRLFLKIGMVVIYTIIFASILKYPSIAVNSYYQDLKNYKGLSGEAWIEKKYPDIYSVILWLKNVPGQPAILEAQGDSYTEFNLISAYTGLPTVSGWFVHEWLWRGSSEFPQGRSNEVTEIYTSKDLNITRNLLSKYGVSYVIVGELERQKYPNLYEEKFNKLGKLVFTSGTAKIYKLN